MSYRTADRGRSPKLIVNAGIFVGEEVLMVKYSNLPDSQSGWFIPHVYVGHGTHPDEALINSLKSQLGLEVGLVRLNHVESFIGNDGSWHLPLNYKVELNEKPKLSPSENIAELKWFDKASLPDPNEVAHHGWALDNIAALIAN